LLAVALSACGYEGDAIISPHRNAGLPALCDLFTDSSARQTDFIGTGLVISTRPVV